MKEKVAVIIFYKNIFRYKKRWVNRFIESLKNQTYENIFYYVINYGEDNYNMVKDHNLNGYFYNIPFDNHVQAQNYVIEKALSDGYNYIFNTNSDDYYSEFRIEIQLSMLQAGYDIVASNFCYIEDKNDLDLVTLRTDFNTEHIDTDLMKGNNILCHPSIGYSRNFLLNNKYNPDEIPSEDMQLWKRSVKDYRFFICRSILCYYRIHDKQVSKINISK